MLGEAIYDRMDSGDVVLVVIPVSSKETGELVGKLNTSGYNAITVDDMSALFKAAGYEQAEQPAPVDLTKYDDWEKKIRNTMDTWSASTNKDKGTSKLLGYIALALTDLVRMHKQAA